MSSSQRNNERRRQREQEYYERQAEISAKESELAGTCTRLLLSEAYGGDMTDAKTAFFTRLLDHLDALGLDTWERLK